MLVKSLSCIVVSVMFLVIMVGIVCQYADRREVRRLGQEGQDSRQTAPYLLQRHCLVRVPPTEVSVKKSCAKCNTSNN